MPRPAALGLLVLLVAGCASPAPSGPLSPPTPTSAAEDSPTAAPSNSPASTATSRPATVPPASASPSPTVVRPRAFDASAVLQVCETFVFPPPEEPVFALECGDAIGVVLAWLGDEAGDATRADMSYSCFDDACPARDPDRAYVAVTTSGGTREITVMRSGNVFSIEGGARERPGPVAPDFTSPPVARPMFDGAPFAIARRRPLPLGGDETVSMGGPCDEAARTCFLHGGLSGSPVELVTRLHATDGEPRPGAELLRNTGTGGVLEPAPLGGPTVCRGGRMCRWEDRSFGEGHGR